MFLLLPWNSWENWNINKPDYIMEITTTFYASHRDDWRKWLEKNHLQEKEIWLVFYKKHTGTPSISYNDAVEEALCYGWIDGIAKRIDEEKYAQRFTPRRNMKNWSLPNRKRVARLFREGKITEAGFRTMPFDPSEPVKEIAETRKEIPIPAELENILRENPPAWENFMNLAPSYRKNYIRWILSAKREETVTKRIKELSVLMKQKS